MQRARGASTLPRRFVASAAAAYRGATLEPWGALPRGDSLGARRVESPGEDPILKKLEPAGLVESRVAVEEHRAVARRFYRLKRRGEIRVSPEQVAHRLKSCGGGVGAEGDGEGDDVED